MPGYGANDASIVKKRDAAQSASSLIAHTSMVAKESVKRESHGLECGAGSLDTYLQVAISPGATSSEYISRIDCGEIPKIIQ